MHVPTIVATRADASAPQHVVAHDERSEAPAVTAEPALGELAALRRNALLARFPDASLRRVAGEATVVQLSAGQTLEVGESVGGNAFFPLTAVLTLTVPGDGREEVKLGAVGSGGVVGLSEPDLLIVRAMTSGTVLRVPKERIATEVANSSSVATLLDRYAKARAAELARESLCNLHHRLERRLARWLITLDELTEGRPFTATHESMARMLGVRRAGVTAAAVDMARDGLIAYHRGSISVLDRERLASLACSCHTLVQSTYEAALRG
jgi:CRP-like cAMP-binding protein